MVPRVGNTWFTGDVCNRHSAGLSEQHPPAFTLLRRGRLDFMHDQCSPLSEYILVFYYSTKLEQCHNTEL
jgi:hypothetical protein